MPPLAGVFEIRIRAHEGVTVNEQVNDGAVKAIVMFVVNVVYV